VTEELRFIAPTGVLGIGYPRASFDAAMAFGPHFIACDAGSADWGPHYLGSGEPWAGYFQTRRDLEPLVLGAREADIPLLIGTAGMSGADVAVDWTFSILQDIVRDHGLSARVARIYSEQRPEDLADAMAEGRISAFEGVDELTPAVLEQATRIVAMMGPEPYQQALADGADIIIAGRSSDAAVYAAVPLDRGIPPEIAWHMGKISECGPAIAPGSGECIVGGINRDSFWVRTARDSDAVTPTTVAVHMLYENPSPYLLREPPGVLDTTHGKYIAVAPTAPSRCPARRSRPCRTPSGWRESACAGTARSACSASAIPASCSRSTPTRRAWCRWSTCSLPNGSGSPTTSGASRSGATASTVCSATSRRSTEVVPISAATRSA
jgi:hypothetical protein